MLFLIGLGLKPKHLTIEALEAIKACDEVFAEGYTSFYSEGTIAELEKIAGKKIKVFGRKAVEEGLKSTILSAKKNNVALLVFGNPLTATTHVQILLEAKRLGVKTKIIEGISVTNALARSGLDEYRFGRTVTIVEPAKNYAPESFYGQIEQNHSLGMHTLCLLDTGDGKKFMSAKKGLEVLEKIEKKNNKSVLKKSLIVFACGLACEKEKIIAGKLEQIKNSDCDVFPQSIIICGKLTEKEKEALGELHGVNL